MAGVIHGAAYGKYKQAEGDQQRLRGGQWDYTNLVIPGRTAGGTVFGVDPHAAENMKIVIDPNLAGTDTENNQLDLCNFTKEEQQHARGLAATLVTGESDIELQRNIAAKSLELLSLAQAGLQKQAKQNSSAATNSAATARPVSPKTVVVYSVPLAGDIPASYDSVTLEDGTLVVGVNKEDASSTYFPSPAIKDLIKVRIGDIAYTAHTTPLKYTLNGLTCAVLLVDSQV